MSINTPWVALLDEDDDDLTLWKYGFDCWGDQLQLHCFTSVNRFWNQWAGFDRKPSIIILAELSPAGDEKNQLQAFLQHECCQESKIFLFNDLILCDEYEDYRQLGATDCFPCVSTVAELQHHVTMFSRHATHA